MFDLQRMFPSMFQRQSDLNFEWSFQPVAVWMRMMGIQLLQCSSSRSRVWNILYGLLMLSFTFVSRCVDMSISEIFSAIKIEPGNENYDAWNAVIDNVKDVLEAFGIHLTMFVVSFWKWKSLWKKLVKMERTIVFGDDFYVTIRKISMVVVVYLSLEMGLTTFFGGSTNLRHIGWVDVGVILGKISSSSIVILFAYLSWMASMMFGCLVRDVTRAAQHSLLDKAVTIDWYMKKWQRNYRLTCKYIKQINECFGLILLVFVMAQSICFITHSFFVCKDVIATIKKGNLLPSQQTLSVAVVNGVHWLWPLIRIYIVSAVCNGIQSQVTELLKALRKLQFSDNVVQIQFNFFIIEVFEAPTRITAMGFFEIDFHLFPKLIGTTLTYLIVFFQLE